MRTNKISGTNFYVFEENAAIGITKFFPVVTLEGAQQLAGALNCAYGVSDVPLALDLVAGRLAMKPIEGIAAVAAPTTHVPTLPATTANRRGVKRGRKAVKRATPPTATL